MLDATFTDPDLTTFTGLDKLGLQAVGQRVDPDRPVLACRVIAEDQWCHVGHCQLCRPLGGPQSFDQRETPLQGVKLIGVDDHVWRHTHKGDKYVTVIINLTAVRDGTVTARLLDRIAGRSKAVFKSWLNQRDQA